MERAGPAAALGWRTEHRVATNHEVKRIASCVRASWFLSIASESPLFMLILIVIEIGPKIDSWVGWPRELRLELPVPLPDDPERRRPNKAHRADCRGSRYQ